MKKITLLIISVAMLVSCKKNEKPVNNLHKDIQGTWELVSNTVIRPDTTVRKDLTGQKMLKIINATHFSFLTHDVSIDGKKNENKVFVAGGGEYRIENGKYIESLEFCNYREWEGHEFSFDVIVRNDSLFQTGVEEIKDLGVNQKIIEIYKRAGNN